MALALNKFCTIRNPVDRSQKSFMLWIQVFALFKVYLCILFSIVVREVTTFSFSESAVRFLPIVISLIFASELFSGKLPQYWKISSTLR